jgi:hypothetical protein
MTDCLGHACLWALFSVKKSVARLGAGVAGMGYQEECVFFVLF